MKGFNVSEHLTQNINTIAEKCHQEESYPLHPHLPRAENPLQWFQDSSVCVWGGAFNLHLISWLLFLGQESKWPK